MSSLASIRSQFAAYKSATNVQIGIKSEMGNFINAEPQLSKLHAFQDLVKTLHRRFCTLPMLYKDQQLCTVFSGNT